MIAYVAAYYGLSPIIVEGWVTGCVDEWHSAACLLEEEKARAYKQAMEVNG